ncbi:MAG: DHH family phosphoesterase [Acidobacteriota bacterium]
MISGQTQKKLTELEAYLQTRGAKGRWLILTHDNPDPDSIASAAALSKLLRKGFRRRVTTAYGGIIGRAENQEMVKTLGIRLSHIRHINWKNYRHFALVDTQPETGNNQLPKGQVPDLIFDHHPLRRASQQAPFTDIRIEYGATATMLTEYLLASGIEISKRNATALVYAIRSETQDFGREYMHSDRAIYDLLHPISDIRALARIRTPGLPISYYQNLLTALQDLNSVGSLVVSHLGAVVQPDIVPEVADLLLRMKGKTWSLCTGIYEDRMYLSIRTTNPRADSGRLMRRLLGRRGKGGGHGMMAGGWIPITDASAGETRALHEAIAARLAKYLKKNPEKFARLLGDGE